MLSWLLHILTKNVSTKRANVGKVSEYRLLLPADTLDPVRRILSEEATVAVDELVLKRLVRNALSCLCVFSPGKYGK